MKPGDRMTWLHVPRGGYGYTYPVDAVVVRVGPKRVRIRVKMRSGEEVERSVLPDSLRRPLQDDEIAIPRKEPA